MKKVWLEHWTAKQNEQGKVYKDSYPANGNKSGRNVLSKTLISVQILSLGVLSAHSQPTVNLNDSRFNIVMFIADDLGVTDIEPYGNKIVKTPNLSRLAGESVLFTNAFAGSPTCSPSRASIHTGLYPFQNGAHANHTGIKPGVKTLPGYLQSLDYRVGFAGKLHIGPGSSYPFELIQNTNVPEPGYEGKGVLWTDLNMNPVDEWLKDVSEANQPFMLVVNDHSPHVIWPEEPKYDYTKINIPPFHIDTEETRKSRARYYTDIAKMDENVGKLLKSLEKHGLKNNTIVIFTADQGPQWAFGKWNLYDYGIRVPLLVKWPSITDGGAETNALVSLVDITPTAIELAGGKTAEIVSAIDGKSLLPLLLGKTNHLHEFVFASHTGDGTMNMSPMRMIRSKRYKYILNLAPDELYNTHMNKAKDHDGGREYWQSWIKKSFQTEHAASVLWRYHNRPAEELYDVLKDPYEMNNLAGEPSYADVVEEFRTVLKQWRNQQGDEETGVYQSPQIKRSEPVTPYIF